MVLVRPPVSPAAGGNVIENECVLRYTSCVLKTQDSAELIPRRRGVAQPGSAPALGAGCRRFESCRPDETKSEQ